MQPEFPAGAEVHKIGTIRCLGPVTAGTMVLCLVLNEETETTMQIAH